MRWAFEQLTRHIIKGDDVLWRCMFPDLADTKSSGQSEWDPIVRVNWVMWLFFLIVIGVELNRPQTILSYKVPLTEQSSTPKMLHLTILDDNDKAIFCLSLLAFSHWSRQSICLANLGDKKGLLPMDFEHSIVENEFYSTKESTFT